MLKNGWGLFVLLAFVCLASGKLQSANEPVATVPDSSAQTYRTVVNRYCISCHNDKLKTAGLTLAGLDLDNVPSGAAVWEKVIRKLRTRQMPPAGVPRPEPSVYDSFANYLESAIDQAAEVNVNPGRPARIRRINRTEYTNAVRDLLGIEIDGRALLPADDAAYGFDNIGDVLTVSPVLLERYMAAAEKISRLAVADTTVPPVSDMYEIPRLLRQDERLGEDLPFGSRGGSAFRRYFPVDAEYVIKVRLQRDSLGDIVAVSEPKQLDLRLDGKRIKVFTVGGDHNENSTDPGQAYARTADAALEVRFPATAGVHFVSVAFIKDTTKPEGALHPPGRNEVFEGLGTVTVAGPYNVKGVGQTLSRSKIFVCHPKGREGEDLCAHKILSGLSRRAYRRPVTEDDVQPLMALFKSDRSKGFEAGIRTAVEGLLVSPGLLLRAEREDAGGKTNAAYRISDLDLASRLSFFLWSSVPDDELLKLAEQAKLHNPEILEQQVRRMLADPRSEALISNFSGQWLFLRNMRTKFPDPAVFPDFDENLREAFIQQSELFFGAVVREDRSVLDFLDADYTFLNERLARHYGIPNVYGSRFRRVTLADENRRGLLGQGSILAVTSYATRTAPTLRGKWLLENVLGTPPPPPPPNVPSLKDDNKARALTMRQRMEQHRANPACATCHKLMDPLGFALENFDAIGRWRTSEANNPIDSSGVLPDGTQFQGPAELRKILLSRREEFVNTLTRKLLTYAVGRGIEYYDFPAIRKITREAAGKQYRWSAIALGIVKSAPFQMRKAVTSDK